MPLFELEDIAARKGIERVRAKSAEEAVRAWLGLPEGADVALQKPDSAMDRLEGWSTIRIADAVRGRIRPHHRMRFRRD